MGVLLVKYSIIIHINFITILNYELFCSKNEIIIRKFLPKKKLIF